ncbi:unnamed protein product, partial [Amoebophrya sp. A25]|eukprot:GSA25T00006583001.1
MLHVALVVNLLRGTDDLEQVWMAMMVADYCSGLAVQFLYEQMPTTKQTISFVKVIKDAVTRETVEEETPVITASQSRKIKSSFFTELGSIWHQQSEAVNIIREALKGNESTHDAQDRPEAVEDLIINNCRSEGIHSKKIGIAKEPTNDILLVFPDMRSELHAADNRNRARAIYHENTII